MQKHAIAARETLKRMIPYTPGKPIWEVQKEYGLDKVIKLASNENPLGPSPKALEAIRRMLPEIHRYPDNRASALVEELSSHYGLEKECLIVSNGGDELITLVSEAYLNPGDEIVVPQPVFSEYEFGATLMEANTVKVPLDEHWQYDIDRLLAAVTDKTKIVYLCSPSNPTGTYLKKDRLRDLLAKLPPRVLVVLDAAYHPFADAPDYTNGLEFVKEGFPVIVLQTFSKIYGLAGIRIGFGAAPAGVIRTLLQVKEPFNVNALAQAAAVAALGDEAFVQASIAANGAGRRQLYAGFEALGISFVPSMSNFVWVRFGPEADAIYEELMKRGIVIRSGRGWGFPDYARISVGSEEDNEAFLNELGKLAGKIR